ncbi:hypothetical protein [Thermomonospora cellulosilytica]|uniref:Uncharacterized protein n=1 Tax=Thermomonospora cellulosilytica TaxID=1411118 RepID=A0A7W3R8J1_9ACTN|nr:hypothetical protein [Thermomonospora cellulosilytica]MBA9003722.1 hypothetical protein [Thermomonospora cellulosilytica]
MYDSIMRTVVPLVVAVLLGQAAKVGLALPEGAVTEIVTVVAGALYYALARVLEREFPAVGRLLLSAGLARGTNPSYVRR